MKTNYVKELNRIAKELGYQNEFNFDDLPCENVHDFKATFEEFKGVLNWYKNSEEDEYQYQELLNILQYFLRLAK